MEKIIGEKTKPGVHRVWGPLLLALVATVGLYHTSRYSYLLFHALTEIFSVVVAFSTFMLTWNSRRYIQNGYLLFVGIGYLALGFLDLLHTLGYAGMPIFPNHGFVANQLWIAARFMESLTMLAAFAYLGSRRTPSPAILTAGFVGATALVVASIFVWRIFPVCFVAGQGQTRFKILSEFVIMAILALDAGLLVAFRKRFEPAVFQALLASNLLGIFTEAAFTVYVSNYGSANLVGHLLKVASYCFIYAALVRTGIEQPLRLVFRELSETNERLRAEVEAHRITEAGREKAILQLQGALEEIRTLQGVIPICSHCKKIRDDQGSWNQLEAYIQAHSTAKFTHGICPDCMQGFHPVDRPEQSPGS